MDLLTRTQEVQESYLGGARGTKQEKGKVNLTSFKNFASYQPLSTTPQIIPHKQMTSPKFSL